MKNFELEEVQNLLQQGKNAEAKQLFENIAETSTVEYWMLKGNIEQRFQQWGKAYNAYLKVQQIDAEHKESKIQIAMIDSILSFWNKDQFNP